LYNGVCNWTVVGRLYALGARLIFHALLSMAEHHGDKARGLVHDVVGGCTAVESS
jgi:hypothetical protein